MNEKEQRVARLFHRLAEQVVPDDTDLRPAVRARLVPRNHPATPRPVRIRPLAAVALLALILAAAVPTAALASAAIRDGLQRFGLVLVGATPSVTPATTAPAGGVAVPATATAMPQAPSGGGAPTWLSLDEARQRAGFPVRVPAWLPSGLVFKGTHVGSSGAVNGVSLGTQVILAYGAGDGRTGGLTIDQVTGAPAGGYAVPAAQAQPAVINGRPATYVRGTLRQDGGWDMSADAGLLSWEEGGVTYVIRDADLGLTSTDLIRIAESLR